MPLHAGGSSTHYLMQWTVYRLSNGTYRIQNFDHHSYAISEGGFWAKPGDSVVGRTEPQRCWKIMEMPTKGDYWCVFFTYGFLYLRYIVYECSICPTTNIEVCWSLQEGESRSPASHALSFPLTVIFKCIYLCRLSLVVRRIHPKISGTSIKWMMRTMLELHLRCNQLLCGQRGIN